MPVALTVHTNLWIESGDTVILSRWRVQLLETIQETGSIRAAAGRLEVSYHRAWDRLNEMEHGLGERLVERQRGGERGGIAHLTPAGHAYVARFKHFAEAVDALIAATFRETFADDSG